MIRNTGLGSPEVKLPAIIIYIYMNLLRKLLGYKICYTCHHLFASGGKVVKIQNNEVDFCSQCQPVWDERYWSYETQYNPDGSISNKIIYFKSVECNENGIPLIGLKKLSNQDKR